MTPNSPQIMKYFLILFAFVCTCVGMSAQVTTAEIEKLKKEQSSLKSKIAENEKLLRAAKSDINSQLNSVMLIDAQVKEQKLYVSKIEKEVKALKAEIKLLEKELNALLADLAHCKAQYQNALLYVHRNRITQSKWFFVFDAEDYRTMYRRLRYVTEYSKFQRAQGKVIQEKEEKVRKQQEVVNAKKKEQEKLLAESRAQQKKMEENLKQRQGVVENLKKKEKQLSKQLSDQRKKASQLNKRIDQLIQKEIEEAERRRKEAERLAKQKNSKSKKQAEKMRKDVAVNQQLSNDFAANKGKFAAPITGSYVISNRYGTYKVEGLRNVSLDNKGINLTGPRGANARTIFKGEVTAVFNLGGLYNVIVSHGKYLTVYCNLSKVIVKQGQKVSTNQILGTVATDDSGNATLQFQVRHGKNTLNPELWIAR
mgnify:CR=1 FL=1